MHASNNLKRMADEAVELVGQGGAAKAKLASLLVEMKALAQILPAEQVAVGRADIVAREEEEAIEAGFDNMPL